MYLKIKSFLKQYQLLRIIYREIYHLWREIAVFLFASWLKKNQFKVITRSQLLTEAEKYNLQEFSSKEIINFGAFYSLQPIPQPIKAKIHQMQVKVVKPFVCEIEEVEIIGKYPVAFDQNKNLILETTLPRFTPVETHIAKNVSIKIILAAQLNKKNTKPPIEIACLLVNPWSNNFWHWTVDTLTQLEGVEYYHQKTGLKPKLIVEPNLRAWQRDSLKLLGYEKDDWIIWQDFRRTVNKLIVPSFRRSYEERYGEVSVSACQWLRQRILANITSDQENTFAPKIFISRRKALGRRISNEAEVIEALKSLGFTTYILEKMNYLQQVKLFAQAKVIIAPHGAGLTNLLFADKPTILELFGSYVGNEFANLSRGLGFKYGCLACPPPRGEMRQKDGDMVVNVTELITLLEMMEKE